ADIAELLEMMSKCRNEGAPPMPLRRMHHHVRRLIDRREMLVLVQDLQRDVLGLRTLLRQFRQVDLDEVAGFQTVGGTNFGSVHQHAAGVNHFAQMDAAVMRKLLREKSIQTQTRLFGKNDDIKGCRRELAFLHTNHRCGIDR
ncbi:MAG: hypothetical protein RIS70_563, partial [Planctomycetota bacterium]